MLIRKGRRLRGFYGYYGSGTAPVYTKYYGLSHSCKKKWFEAYSDIKGHFGDVDLTFELVEKKL